MARKHWAKAAVLAIPFILALTNGTWLTSGMGDVDSWTYNGYFRMLRVFAANRAAWGPPAYFETRLPIIVPGALVYGPFSDGLARVVLNLCILHGTIALSFWYVVRTHLSRTAATAATTLLATDIFYVRTIGWDYVDNAVLAYQALTFALLTRLPVAKRPALCAASAGFAATSMVAVHLGSVVMLPVLAAYALFVAERASSRSEIVKRGLRLALWSAVGGTGCLFLYGLVSRILLGGPFFFFMEQLRRVEHVKAADLVIAWRPLLASGAWLVIHAAVFTSCLAALVIVRWRGTYLSRFARFCFWAIPLLYATVLIGDLAQRSFYMTRAGVYATNFLLLAYMSIAALLFARPHAKPWIAWVVLLVFPSIAITRLALHDGLGLAFRFPQPMYAIAIGMTIAVVVGFAIERAAVLVGSIVVLGVCSLFVPYSFTRDDRILEARGYILANGAPPRVFYSEADPQRNQFVSIASALTEHVVHDHYRAAGASPIVRGEPVVVLESCIAGDERELAPCAIAGLIPAGSRVLTGRYLDMHVHLFTADQDAVPRESVHCRQIGAASTGFTLLRTFLATELPGPVGEPSGEDGRIATPGRAGTGFLTEGPGLGLPVGVYQVTFHYSAHGGENAWHVWAKEAGESRRIADGLLPDTAGRPNTLSIAFKLPAAVDDLQTKTAFHGSGQLRVDAVMIHRRVGARAALDLDQARP